MQGNTEKKNVIKIRTTNPEVLQGMTCTRVHFLPTKHLVGVGSYDKCVFPKTKIIIFITIITDANNESFDNHHEACSFSRRCANCFLPSNQLPFPAWWRYSCFCWKFILSSPNRYGRNGRDDNSHFFRWVPSFSRIGGSLECTSLC